MSNICKTVTLRARKIKDGTQLSYYLDYYPSYRDEATMKVTRHESLGIYIYAKPKNQRERNYNDRMREKAEALRCRRFESIVNERYDFFDKEKMKGDFLAYFKDKADKKNTKWQHVYKHFHRFVNGKCTFGEINVDLCNKFMEYLKTAPQFQHTNRKLHINSVAGYWSTFRAVLHTAYRDKKIKENPKRLLGANRHHTDKKGTPLAARTRKIGGYAMRSASAENRLSLRLFYRAAQERHKGIDMGKHTALQLQKDIG